MVGNSGYGGWHGIICIYLILGIEMANFFNWIQSTQNWFSKTEKSSGFRSYLIYLWIILVFTIVVFAFLNQYQDLKDFAIFAFKWSFIGFIVIFFIKAIFDPDFCRSEKHIENVKKLEFSQQKGESSPSLIDLKTSSTIVLPQQRSIEVQQ